MDGVPVSYQQWNNYLIKNPNYYEDIEFSNKVTPKGIETLITLNEEGKHAMNAIQPQLEKENHCVIMVTRVLAQPDWTTIPCFQKIPSFVVCQKIIDQGKGNVIFTKNENGSLHKEVDICQNNNLLIENRCISFRKYNNQMKLSELKYDKNDIGFTEIINQEKETLFQYFTIIQHFYFKPLQFTISIPFNNTYLYYTPYQTKYVLKLTWKRIISKLPIY